jgi:hypothetical protein
MITPEKLTDHNFIGVAMHYYDNVQCNTIEEFENDLYRIMCIKKIIDRYNASGKINLRLVLNHVIILHNAFGVLTVELLRYKLEQQHLPIIKPILVFLGYMESDYWNDVIDDSETFNQLRRI